MLSLASRRPTAPSMSSDDVGVAGVPMGLGDHVHEDLVQRDLAPLPRPPRHLADGIQPQRVDRGVRMRPDTWYRPTTCSRDSSVVAHMSALFGALVQPWQRSGNGRLNVSPKYRASTLATCLTSPSRLVPVGTNGWRASYSDSPSSFHTSASRAAWR